MSTTQQQSTASIDSNDVTLNCASPLGEFYIKIHLKYEIQNVNINDTSQRIPKVLLLNFTTVLVDFPLLLPYWTAETSLVLLFYSHRRTADDDPLWMQYLIPTCQVTDATLQEYLVQWRPFTGKWSHHQPSRASTALTTHMCICTFHRHINVYVKGFWGMYLSSYSGNRWMPGQTGCLSYNGPPPGQSDILR